MTKTRSTRLLIGLVAALLAVGGVFATAAAAPRQSQPQQIHPQVGFMIASNLTTNLCLDIRASNAGVGATVGPEPCNGNNNQLWQWNGTELVSGLNGMCLDINDGNRLNGAGIDNWPCHGGSPQDWHWNGSQLQDDLNRCLGIAGVNPGTGAALVMWTCNGSPDQQWRVA